MQVVSIELVIIKLGLIGFQSKLVRGAVKSVLLLFDNNARGVSFCVGGSRSELVRVMELPAGVAEEEDVPDGAFGMDQRRRWSPEVAIKSVRGLVVLAGSQRIRVIGYVWDASASLENSREGAGGGVSPWLTFTGVGLVSRIWIYNR